MDGIGKFLEPWVSEPTALVQGGKSVFINRNGRANLSRPTPSVVKSDMSCGHGCDPFLPVWGIVQNLPQGVSTSEISTGSSWARKGVQRPFHNCRPARRGGDSDGEPLSASARTH